VPHADAGEVRRPSADLAEATAAINRAPHRSAGGPRAQVPRAYVVLKPTHSDTPQLRKDIQDYLDARVAPHKVGRGTCGRMAPTALSR